MKALVSGGAGFIGSNLVDALVGRGDSVTVLDDLSTGRRENLAGALERGAVLHEADVRDAERVAALVAEAAPQAIFHLAAQIDVRHSVADPAFDFSVNVGGTINLLEAARRAGVPRFVNTSTGGAIYGDAEPIPTGEDVRPAPLSPYGQSKHAAEGYAGLYSRLHGLSAISLRCSNVYGPRQDPLGEGGVVAIFCGRLLDGRTATIFGDGGQTRDYVFVGDVVAANLAAADSDAQGAFNVGTGVETTVLALAGALRELGDGRPFEPELASERPGELHRSAIDPRRAREVLGWEARTALADGLRLTLDTLRR